MEKRVKLSLTIEPRPASLYGAGRGEDGDETPASSTIHFSFFLAFFQLLN